MKKTTEIDYELDDIKNNDEIEVSIISKIKKSKNYAMTILFIAKKFYKNENVTVSELSKFLCRDKAYAFQVLENLEIYGLIKKIKPIHYKYNVYVPILNDGTPVIYEYIKLAKDTLKIKKVDKNEKNKKDA